MHTNNVFELVSKHTIQTSRELHSRESPEKEKGSLDEKKEFGK